MHLKTAWCGLCLVWRMKEGGGWLTGIITPGGWEPDSDLSEVCWTVSRPGTSLVSRVPQPDVWIRIIVSWEIQHPLFFLFLCLSSPLCECCSASSVSLQVSMDDRRRCCSGPAYVTTPSSTNTSLTIYIHSPATSLGKLVQSNVMGINGNKWRVFGFWTVGWTKEAIWRRHFGLWEIAMSIFPIFLD